MSSSHSTVVQLSCASDAQVQQQLGYKQELYRGVGCFMNFTFCFTSVAVVTTISALFPTAIATGGPAWILLSWVIVCIFTMLIALSLAEICSTYPSAGSVYLWAGCLASEDLSPIISYCAGWLNLIGNTAGNAFLAYAFSNAVSGAIVMDHGKPMPTIVRVLIGIGVCLCWTLTSLARIDKQGWITNFAAVWQILAAVIIITTILWTCSISSTILATPSQILFQTYNGTGFESYIYVFLIGLLSAIYALTGYDSGAHLAEETRRAQISAPMGIIWTCIVSGIVGLIYWLGLLIPTASDVKTFVQNGSSTTHIFEKCGGPVIGLGLSIILIVNMYFSGMSSFTITTRIVYSMARDGALPGFSKLKQVNSRTGTPIAAVFFIFIMDVLLLLINIVNSSAFIAVTSISAIGYQLSYAIAILMRVTFSKNTFTQSRSFNLGKFGVRIGWINVIFLTLTSICFLFPTTYPITFDNMNYTTVVLFITLIVGCVHWNFFAKLSFKGPKRSPRNLTPAQS